MAFTAGDVADKISELRSRIAVHKVVIQTILANYMESDHGAPEIELRREDGARVTDEHLQASKVDIEGVITSLEEELQEWENMTFSAPVEEKKPEAPVLQVVKKEKVRANKRVGVTGQPGASK